MQSLDQLIGNAQGKGKKSKGSVEPVRTLTDEHRKAIMAIVHNKVQTKLDQEAIRDDTKAVAEKLGLKTGDLNKIISLVITEQEKGGAIQEQENIADLANQVLKRNAETEFDSE